MESSFRFEFLAFIKPFMLFFYEHVLLFVFDRVLCLATFLLLFCVFCQSTLPLRKSEKHTSVVNVCFFSWSRLRLFKQ